jgi:hypothetical protein
MSSTILELMQIILIIRYIFLTIPKIIWKSFFIVMYCDRVQISFIYLSDLKLNLNEGQMAQPVFRSVAW